MRCLARRTRSTGTVSLATTSRSWWRGDPPLWRHGHAGGVLAPFLPAPVDARTWQAPGYPHIHSSACPHLRTRLTSVSTKALHKLTHRNLRTEALFWQPERLWVSMSQRRACDIAFHPPARPAGGDLHAHRLLTTGGPGQVFAARGRDLMSDQTLGGTPMSSIPLVGTGRPHSGQGACSYTRRPLSAVFRPHPYLARLGW